MKEKPEKMESKEQPTSKIVLEIFRHGEKEKQKEGELEYEVRLTPKGREQATEKGKKIHPQPNIAMALGSPRKRTQETATRAMLAEKEEITPEMSLEEIEKIISLEQKYGKKITIDPRLNFNIEGPAGKKIHENFKAGRLLEYMIHESDNDAINLKDKEASTYSRTAGNIAELVKKYVEIAPKFDKIVKQNPEKYMQYKNQMERYMGSHQSIAESFMAKVLEKTKGLEERDKFVKSLGTGFKETQGIRVEINNTSQGVKTEIKYKIGDQEETLEVPEEILDEIIKDRDDLNKKMKEG